MLKNEEVTAFFNSVDFDKLLIQVGKDAVVSFKNKNEWLQNHPATAIVFSKPEDTWNKIRNTYRTSFKEMVMGELPDESSLITTLKEIQGRLKKVEWNIS